MIRRNGSAPGLVWGLLSAHESNDRDLIYMSSERENTARNDSQQPPTGGERDESAALSDPDPQLHGDVRDDANNGHVCRTTSCHSRDDARPVDLGNTGEYEVLCARCRTMYGGRGQ